MSPRNESFTFSTNRRPSFSRRPSFNDPTKPTFDVKTDQTASRTPSPTNVCMTEAEELPPQPPQRKKGMLSNLRASITLPNRRRSLEKGGSQGSLHLSNSSIGSANNGMERSGSSTLNRSGHSAAAEAHLRESNHGSDAEEEDVVSSNSTGVTASSTPNSSARSSRANLGRLSSYSKRNKAQYSNHSFHHGYMDNMRSTSPAIDEEVPLPCNSEHNESLTELADQLYASSVSNNLRRSITQSITEEGNVEDEGEYGDGDDSSRRRASSFASDDVSNDLDKRYQDSEALLESLGESPSEADLTKVTTARVSEIVREQSMEDRVRFANIPRFTKSDVLIGRHLGKGCFSDVFDVTVTLENDQSQMGEGTSLELNNRIRAKFGNSVGAASKPSPFDYKPVNKNALPPVFKVGGGSSHCSGKSDHSSDESDDEEDLDKFIDANFGGGDVDRSASAPPPDDGEDLDALIEAKFGGGYMDRSASAPPPGSHLDKFSDYRRSSDPVAINEDAEDKADVGTDFKPTQIHRPSLQNPSRQRRVTTDLSSSVCVGSVSAARRTVGRSRRLNLAMKCLRPICRSDAQKFMIGVEDLVHETVILSSIDHPNIIKIHGRAELGEGYFILLDKLKDTLEDRIEGWRKMFPQSSRNPPSINQVKVAKTLADTVAFLHDRNIVFHDLKPPNVGFDERGQLKLFDFGFAVEVVDDEPLEDKAGTVRYMSPEVGLELGHGLPSDVYSFSILLWEIFSLKKPFAKIKSPNEFKRIVFDGGERPKLGKNWSVEMKEEIERGWSDKPNQRPSMDDFAKLLSKWQQECPARAKPHNDKSLRGSIVRMKSRMSWDA